MLERGTLYGFDARVPPSTADPDWIPERRERFLLRRGVARPLSVDGHVWPPVPDARPTDGFAPDYWASLERLRAACRTARVGHSDATVIALAYIDGEHGRALLTPVTPSEAADEWQLLGYDVADSGLTSALSNAGFDPGREDVEALRRRFAPAIDERGLFQAVEDARTFRVLSDERAPEHAPFLVHAVLWVAGAQPAR